MRIVDIFSKRVECMRTEFLVINLYDDLRHAFQRGSIEQLGSRDTTAQPLFV